MKTSCMVCWANSKRSTANLDEAFKLRAELLRRWPGLIISVRFEGA